MPELWPPKDPNEVKDYDLIWTYELAGDTILSSTWSLPTGSSLSINSNSFTSTSTSSATKVWLSGGVIGQSYILTNTVVTAAGRTEDATVQITIMAK
jgi:hypothetical protein